MVAPSSLRSLVLWVLAALGASAPSAAQGQFLGPGRQYTSAKTGLVQDFTNATDNGPLVTGVASALSTSPLGGTTYAGVSRSWGSNSLSIEAATELTSIAGWNPYGSYAVAEISAENFGFISNSAYSTAMVAHLDVVVTTTQTGYNPGPGAKGQFYSHFILYPSDSGPRVLFQGSRLIGPGGTITSRSSAVFTIPSPSESPSWYMNLDMMLQSRLVGTSAQTVPNLRFNATATYLLRVQPVPELTAAASLLPVALASLRRLRPRS